MGHHTTSRWPDKAKQRPLIAILGPTGSGKSEAALRLREVWPIEVVNCDSLQVYRYLDIGTAKLTPAERANVPHHMMDLLHPNEFFSAGDFARRARPIVRSISDSGRLPVVAGGTGFYLKALLDGFFPGPARDEKLRANLLERERRRPGLLHRFLAWIDPAASNRIHVNDTNKLVRAVEICLLTRSSLSAAHEGARDALEGYRTLKIILNPPREALYQRLDRRAELMFERGLVEEVRQIAARGYATDGKPFESLGYRQALEFIRGEITEAEAVESTCRDTRRYAKRQWTWFRREKGAQWLSGFGFEERTQANMLITVKEFLRDFSEFSWETDGTIPTGLRL